MPDSSKLPPIRQMRAEALRLDRVGAHDRAEVLLAQVLAMSEATPGDPAQDLADALNDLARCRFNGGRLLPALRDYRRLLQLLGPDTADPRADIVRHQIGRCLEGVRQRLASANLQAQIALVIRQARAQRAVGETADQQRLRSLARRLLARGRVDAGSRLMQRWLDQLQRAWQHVDDDALSDLRDHAIALWNLGRTHDAAAVLRSIVLVQLRQHRTDPQSWVEALRDWSACLASAGQHRSAQETMALAESLSEQQDRPGPRKDSDG